MQIRFDGITKNFGVNRVIDTISVETQTEGCLSIIGPSGGGKSTLLRLIGGLLIPDEGSITIDGKKIDYNPKNLVSHRKTIGVVFQNYNLFPHLSALDNIVLPMTAVHQMDKAHAIERAKECLNRFKMFDHAHKYPGQLSGGQSQRVAIARAVAHNPEYVLLDEPTSALDPEMTIEVLEVIKELSDTKTNLIMVTHHMEFARQVSDKIFYLDAGKIIESGTPSEVFDSPKYASTQQFFKKVLSFGH